MARQELHERWIRRADGCADAVETLRDDEGQLQTDFGAFDATDRLEILERIGRGGMCTVHAARQPFFGRRVAVKSSRRDLDEPDSRQLLDEARITGFLEHPHIVPVYDVDGSSGAPRIVMRLVAGRAWSDLIADGDPGGLRGGLEVLLKVCDALGFAHAHGFVHRDVKPHNVMVGAYGEVYLMDWGLAVAVVDDPRFPTLGGRWSPVGTPAYVAPEMVDPDGVIGPPTDVFLLGGCLYHLLAGRPPRRGTPRETLVAALHGRHDPLPPGVPDELARLCVSMLAVAPADRPTLDTVRDAVRGFIAHQGLAEMVARAEAPSAALERALAAGDEAAARESFTSARSILEAVLETAPERADARAAHARIVRAMASWSLDRGDVGAARFLLDGCRSRPADLVARLEQLEAEERERRARLDALTLAEDTRSGGARRGFIVGLVSLGFLGDYLIMHFMERTYLRPVAMALVAEAVVLPLVVYAFLRLPPTRLNRRGLVALASMPLVVLPMSLGNWWAGTSHADNGRNILIVYFVGCLTYALANTFGFLPAAFAWLLAFGATSAFPEIKGLGMIAALLVTIGNAVALSGGHLLSRR